MRPAAMAAILAMALGACSMPEFDGYRGFDTSVFKPRSTAVLREPMTRTVTAADLVDGSGACAAAPSAPAPEQTAGDPQAIPPAGAPLIAGGVALEMTECDVVHRIGPPERVDIGQNERNERTATLTYVRGARPGVYQFTAGRLTVIERAPEPPAPARPARPQRPAPKRTAS